MKTITCRDMGGPCDMKMSSNSEKGLIDEGTKHVKKFHPEMLDKMKNMSEEETMNWRKMLHEKWTATPDSK